MNFNEIYLFTNPVQFTNFASKLEVLVFCNWQQWIQFLGHLENINKRGEGKGREGERGRGERGEGEGERGAGRGKRADGERERGKRGEGEGERERGRGESESRDGDIPK